MPYISGMDKLLRGEGPRRGEWVSPFDISPEKKPAEPKPAKIEAAGLANKPAVIRAATPDEIARDKEKEQQWAESKYSKMSGIDAALAYGSMKPKERTQLPEYVQWKLQNIYQSESENAKTAAESRYDGVGSSEADAFFRAYGDAANLYLPSIAAQLSGGDAAGKAKMGQLNQQRHPIISGVGEVLGWMTPSLSNAASTGFSASKPVKKLTGMAERGVAHGLGKLTGKSTFAAAHPNLMRVGTKALQGAASNAIMAGGSGTITGALQSAAKGNDAKTIASDALREGWDSAKYGAIGGGIRGGLHGLANVNGISFPGDGNIDPRLEVYRDDDAIRYTAPEKLPEYEPWMEAYRDDADRLLLQDGAESGIMGANEKRINLNDMKFSLEPDRSFFWSGLGKEGATVAADFAKKNGGVTLETTLESNNIQMPEWNPYDPETINAWINASEIYAQRSSGEVRALVGAETRPNSIWNTRELPALKANPKVKKIILIDPLTGTETTIFTR